MAFPDPKELMKSADKTFFEAVVKNLKIDTVRRVITVPLVKGASFPEYDEYADYISMANADVLGAAKQLGAGVATLYNALISNAIHSRRHGVVTDLFAGNNLKFNVAMIDGPSVTDPAGLIGGWVSFRFHFRSSNERPESLSDNQTVLSKLNAR